MRNWINLVTESTTEYAYHSTSASLRDISQHGLRASEWEDEEISQIIGSGTFYLVWYTDEPQTEYGETTFRFVLKPDYLTEYSSDRGAFIYSERPFAIPASCLEHETENGWKPLVTLTESANEGDMLYHGTCLPHLAYIFESNSMHVGSDDAWGGGEAGVSFTTDQQTAVEFAHRSLEPYMLMAQEITSSALDAMPNSTAVLTLSRQDLEGQYRVDDYQDPDVDEGEDEVRVFSDIHPVLPLVRTADYDSSSITWWLKFAKLTKDKALHRALTILSKR